MVPERSAVAHSTKIVSGETSAIPSVRNMITAGWHVNDLGQAFQIARREVIRRCNINVELDEYTDNVDLKWCNPFSGAFNNLPAMPVGVIRVLLWDIWRDLLAMIHGPGVWYIEYGEDIPQHPTNDRTPGDADVTATTYTDVTFTTNADVTITPRADVTFTMNAGHTTAPEFDAGVAGPIASGAGLEVLMLEPIDNYDVGLESGETSTGLGDNEAGEAVREGSQSVASGNNEQDVGMETLERGNAVDEGDLACEEGLRELDRYFGAHTAGAEQWW